MTTGAENSNYAPSPELPALANETIDIPLSEYHSCLPPNKGGCGELYTDPSVFVEGNDFCQKCRERHAQEAKEKRRREVCERLAKEMVRPVRSSAAATHICEVTDKVIENLGGVNQFAEMWANSIKALQTRVQTEGVGHKALTDAMWQVGRLVTISTQYRDTVPNVENMEADQIEQEINSLLMSMMVEKPETVLKIAAQIKEELGEDAA